jgi:hypothetical protein
VCESREDLNLVKLSEAGKFAISHALDSLGGSSRTLVKLKKDLSASERGVCPRYPFSRRRRVLKGVIGPRAPVELAHEGYWVLSNALVRSYEPWAISEKPTLR